MIASIKKFSFIKPVNPNKFYYKNFQDNDSKHKSNLLKSWLLYNCTKVIDTAAQSPDVSPIENYVGSSKEKCRKKIANK